jgi:hypothetical protein
MTGEVGAWGGEDKDQENAGRQGLAHAAGQCDLVRDARPQSHITDSFSIIVTMPT